MYGNAYNSNFNNTYKLLINGYSDANAYTMMSNNYLYADSKKTNAKSENHELEKMARIEKFKFLNHKPRHWSFELTSNNTLNKKKVKDLPDNYKNAIIKIDRELKNNQKTLSSISKKSEELQKMINEKMKNLIEENILSIKMINIKLCKVGSKLSEVTSLMSYYESICLQIKRYCETTKNGNSPVYEIPSNNAKTVAEMMKEKLKIASETIDELTLMLTNDQAQNIPEDPMR